MNERLKQEISHTYHDGSVTDTNDIDHVSYENIAQHFYNLALEDVKNNIEAFLQTANYPIIAKEALQMVVNSINKLSK